MKKKNIAVLALALILTSCGNADNDRSAAEKSSTVSSEVSIVTDNSVESADSSSGSDLPEESSKADESSSEASDSENVTQTVTTKTTFPTVADTTTAESAEYLPEPDETTTTTAPATTTATTTAPEPVTTTTPKPTTTTTTTQPQPIPEVNAMKININGTVYTAHFSDTAAAEEFKAMLPLTLEMSELNGNEKFIYLDSGFTTSSENVGYINKGDIMLYGSSCVVLFYDSFSTPYSYTRLGYIDDPRGLENAVGSGSVTVTFEEE